jgi:uncharacterized protein (TIGR03437 family)
MSVAAQPLAPSFFIFGAGPYVAAVHTNGNLVGPASLSVPGYTFAPVKPGETFLLYANGFGPTSVPLISGATTQGGTLSPPPVVTIGGLNAAVQFAWLVFPHLPRRVVRTSAWHSTARSGLRRRQ